MSLMVEDSPLNRREVMVAIGPMVAADCPIEAMMACVLATDPEGVALVARAARRTQVLTSWCEGMVHGLHVRVNGRDYVVSETLGGCLAIWGSVYLSRYGAFAPGQESQDVLFEPKRSVW
jgi:hypothetical protein